MRMRLIAYLILFICFNSPLLAQKLELGVFGGISNYFGDLQQSNFEVETVQPAFGVFARYHPSNQLALKFQLYKGEITGDDALYPELMPVRERNLNFKSPIYEASVQAEVTLISFGENDKKLAAPYLFAGIGMFYFNPQARFQGHWVDLQPLGTEGQGWQENRGRQYSRVQMSIPMGIGFNVRVAESVNVGFECGFRKTFTDHLDDVSGAYPDIEAFMEENPMGAALSFRSQELHDYAIPNPEGELRGSPDSKDLYFFGGITLSMVLKDRIK